MTAREVINLGVRVRKAQKQYFRTRTSVDLDRSKSLEREFDRACKDFLEAGGPGLFDAQPQASETG